MAMKGTINVAMVVLALAAVAVGEAASQARQPRGKALNGEPFRFVVLGDSRTPGGKYQTVPPGRWPRVKSPEVSPVFVDVIKQINLTPPDLVVNTGDLVWGHCPRELLIREWDAFDKAIAGFDAGMYMVVGNHDIWDEMSERVYTERYGPMWYSFNHKGAHFVVLCTEVPNKAGRIGPKQLAWLREDLRKHASSKPKYVFLHQPLWAYGGQTPDVVPRTREDGAYQLWMETVHPILKSHKVDAVFGGHWHQYLAQEIDGIRYVTTGGGGGELGGYEVPPEALGRFYHYLIVTVRDGKTRIAVVKLDGIQREDVITPEGIRAANRKRFTFDEMRTDFGTVEGKMLKAPDSWGGVGNMWLEPKGGNPGFFIDINMYFAHRSPKDAKEYRDKGAAAIGRRITLPENPKDIVGVDFSVDYANWRTDRTLENNVWLMVVPAASWDHADGDSGRGDYNLAEPDPALYVQRFTTKVRPEEFLDEEKMERRPRRNQPRGGTYPIKWARAEADREALLPALKARAGEQVVFVVQVRNDWGNNAMYGHIDNIVAEVTVQSEGWRKILTK